MLLLAACAMPVRAQELSDAVPEGLILLDGRALASARSRAQAEDAELAPALAQLRRAADRTMQVPPPSVTQKSVAPPSGDLHDYVSLSIYYWPDPKKPDGKPYVSRDGEINPEVHDAARYDADRLGSLLARVHTLAWGSYLLRDPSYGWRAAELLRVWFLDPGTRMHPRFTYAQVVPGRPGVRGIGIIESRGFVRLADDLVLLRAAGALSAEDETGVRGWLGEFLTWLRTSPEGVREAAEKNNHGTWYDVQVAGLALATNQTDFARAVLSAVPEKRIAAHVEPDGRLPLELARTKSLSYTVFDLTAFAVLASLAPAVGVDLWGYTSVDGRALRTAVDTLLPYATGEAVWEGRQIAATRADRLYPPVFAPAARAFPDGPYAGALSQTMASASPLQQLEVSLGYWPL